MKTEDLIFFFKRSKIEVISFELFKELKENNKFRRIYFGLEPSGDPHIGILPIVLFFEKLVSFFPDLEIIILLADWHAYLNEKGTFEEIKISAQKIIDIFQKARVSKISFIWGSELLTKNYLKKIIFFSEKTSLNRVIRSLEIMGRKFEEKKSIAFSKLLYPMMQAVDISILKVDGVLSGMDQRKVHMLFKEIVKKTFSEKNKIVFFHFPIIPGLMKKKNQNEKMSKSNEKTTIFFNSSKNEIFKKIQNSFFSFENFEKNPLIQILRILRPYDPTNFFFLIF